MSSHYSDNNISRTVPLRRRSSLLAFDIGRWRNATACLQVPSFPIPSGTPPPLQDEEHTKLDEQAPSEYESETAIPYVPNSPLYRPQTPFQPQQENDDIEDIYEPESESELPLTPLPQIDNVTKTFPITIRIPTTEEILAKDTPATSKKYPEHEIIADLIDQADLATAVLVETAKANKGKQRACPSTSSESTTTPVEWIPQYNRLVSDI